MDSSAELEPTRTDAVRRWGRPLRWLVSAWLIYHLAGVVISPASVPPSSPLVREGWRFFQPYLQVFYLSHGYHYFAPEPAQSTLVAYTAELPDGTTRTGRFPHRGMQPRLMYHRHFMLTEFLAFPRSPEEQRLWYRSYARHLCRRHGADRVSLSRITHYLPTMELVREGVSLDDPEGYAEEPLGVFECDEL